MNSTEITTLYLNINLHIFEQYGAFADHQKEFRQYLNGMRRLDEKL